MNNIKIAFKYTRPEYVSAVRSFLFATRKLRKFDFVILAICAVMSVYYLISSYSALSLVFFIVVVIAFLLYAWSYIFMPLYVYKSTAKLHEDYRLEFSAEGIAFNTQTIDSHLKWDVYRNYLENERFFYLMQTANVYTVIPKRVFGDEAQLEAFRTLTAEKLKAYKKS